MSETAQVVLTIAYPGKGRIKIERQVDVDLARKIMQILLDQKPSNDVTLGKALGN